MTSTTPEALTTRLASRVLVGDGAMGTMLHAAGNSLDHALPALALSEPELVRRIHTAYVDAGVDVITTNTFGANRLRLDDHGLAERTADINANAVRIARDAARTRPSVLVAGSVSPAITAHQRRRVSAASRIEALREQIAALVEAGVDLLVLETFGHLDELVEAVEIAMTPAGVPVIAQTTFGADLRTLCGHTAHDVVNALSDAPIAALGTNCTLGPQRLLTVLRELREHSALPLTGSPNAGLPRRIGPARFEYDIDSEYMVRYIGALIDAGASLVGGCCGTTPTQLAAVVRMAQDRQTRAVPRAAPAVAPAARTPATVTRAPFAEHERPVLVELSPEAVGDPEHSTDLARRLVDLGATTVSISAGNGIRSGLHPVDLALHLQQRLARPAVATVTTRDRTIMALQADLLGAHARGLRRVIAETGSPPLLGDYPPVDGVWDVESIGLVELLVGLNEGTDFYGLPLPAPTAFEIGARVTPGSRHLAAAASRAREKIAAGAQFLVTRPVYELDGLARLLDELGDDRPPVLVAVRPLSGFLEAEYLAHEVPDVSVPASTLRLLEQAGPAAEQAGLELACELAAELRGMAAGLVIVSDGTDLEAVRRLMEA